MKIINGTIDDAIKLESMIPEFARTTDRDKYVKKLNEKSPMILIAMIEDKMVGFKVGYEKSDSAFYSWIGGVLPEYRGQGIAKNLLTEMEDRLREKGYNKLETKTMNKYKNMLLFNISNDFHIYKFENDKIFLEKILK